MLCNRLWYCLGVGCLSLHSPATPHGHSAPLPCGAFVLGHPAPSAGSLPMPVGCPALTQGRAAGSPLGLGRMGESRSGLRQNYAAGMVLRRRHQPSRPPQANIRPGGPAPAMGPGMGTVTPPNAMA
jgi:hypothetical protein